MSDLKNLSGVEFLTPVGERDEEILTPDAVAFIVDLQRTFNARRKSLLEARHERQKKLDAGEKPDFLEETRQVREAEWTVAPLPRDIL
ncbi:MAG: malate synthase A, partial [Terracidiphilus sp.]